MTLLFVQVIIASFYEMHANLLSDDVHISNRRALSAGFNEQDMESTFKGENLRF